MLKKTEAKHYMRGLSTRHDFANWMLMAFSSCYEPSKSPGNEFRALHRSARFETSTDAMRYLYREGLSHRKRKRFRHAIGDALRMCTQYSNLENVAEDCLYLAASLRAYEALDGTYTYVTQHPGIGRPLYACMSMLKMLHPGKRLESFVRKLQAHESFDNGYILEVIAILIACRPNEAEQIISEFEPNVVTLIHEARECGESDDDIRGEICIALISQRHTATYRHLLQLYESVTENP